MTGRRHDDHSCQIPVAGPDRRKFWWTCPECGQLWRKVDRAWKLTAREAN